MNDNFFNYLVATDELDDFLGYEPKCPNCGNKLAKIIYGMPSSDIMNQVEKGEVFIGGCCVDEANPKYHCNICRRSYYSNLKDYIIEGNNFEEEDA